MVGAVIEKRPDIDHEALERYKKQMNTAAPDCVVSGYQPLVATLNLPDPQDRHVPAAAIVARANVVVTFNAKDFPEEVLTPLGLHMRHPDEFIADVESLDSALFVEHVGFGIGRYREPPLAVAHYCASLRKAGVPKTADLIEEISILFDVPFPP